jgi:histidinol-phosphate/aromatic aminotransferase/cobyric acid decarboxylase-like protein
MSRADLAGLSDLLPRDGVTELATGLPYARLIAYQRVFARELGARLDIDPGLILPTAGSMGGIEAVRNHLLLAVGPERRTALTVRPGYWRARQSLEGGGFTVHDHPLEPVTFDLDEDAFLARADELRPALVYLSLPNNPTGATFDAVRLAAELPASTAVLFDLTLPAAERSVVEPLARLHRESAGRRGLFFVASTSKSHGTAEDRVGWVVASHAEDGAALERENRNVVSIPALDRCLERMDETAPTVARVAESHAQLEAAEAAGAIELVRPRRRVRSCYALVRPAVGSRRALEALEAAGVRVMPGAACGAGDDLLRLELSEPAAVARCLAVLVGLDGREGNRG